MTGEELVNMWTAESDAANDCIIEILESYMEFARLVEQHANLRNETILLTLAKRRLQNWAPILQQAKVAKAKTQQ